MISRTLISLMGAVLFSVFFLLLLNMSIAVRNTNTSADNNLKFIDFVRLKKEQQLQKKERVKPKKPKPKKKPPRPKIKVPKPEQKTVQKKLIEPLNLNMPMDLSSINGLGDAMVSGFGQRAVNSSVIPLVRINPVYPKRARLMKKEGYVKMEFTITKFGSVKNIEVMASEPPGMFDSAAKRALLKWKFRPKKDNNKALAQQAMVKLDFRLDR